MGLFGALFMQMIIIRWVLAIILPLAIGLGFRYSDNTPSFARYRPDPGIARASDEWRDAAKRKKDGLTKSEDAIEAAIDECMATWEQTPLELRAEFGKPKPSEAEAREKMRPVAEARCRRSARYRN